MINNILFEAIDILKQRHKVIDVEKLGQLMFIELVGCYDLEEMIIDIREDGVLSLVGRGGSFEVLMNDMQTKRKHVYSYLLLDEVNASLVEKFHIGKWVGHVSVKNPEKFLSIFNYVATTPVRESMNSECLADFIESGIDVFLQSRSKLAMFSDSENFEESVFGDGSATCDVHPLFSEFLKQYSDKKDCGEGV